MDYLLSVGIATRNRQKYAKQVIEQIAHIDKKIEICVSDNSTERTLEMELSDLIKTGQVKYQYYPERISVVKNYNNTADMANGEYYICIGDDDIILPTIFDVIHWMGINKLDAVRTSRQLSYMWPINGEHNGKMNIGFFTDDCHLFDPFANVIKLLKNGCQGYLYSDMAGSYHALVRMEKMKEVKSRTGFYFNGFSPDIYSAVCLSLLPGIQCAYFGFPVSVPGACDQSATYRARKRKAVSSVEKAIGNYSSSGYQWDNLIPYYYTPETTWADTTLKAVRMMGHQALIDQYYNQELLVNLVYNRWTEYREEITKNFTSKEWNLVHEDKIYSNPNVPDTNRSFWDKVYSRLTGDVKVYQNVSDNYAAEKIFVKYINSKRQNKKWNLLLNSLAGFI